jgi:hypothetical protein
VTVSGGNLSCSIISFVFCVMREAKQGFESRRASQARGESQRSSSECFEGSTNDLLWRKLHRDFCWPLGQSTMRWKSIKAVEGLRHLTARRRYGVLRARSVRAPRATAIKSTESIQFQIIPCNYSSSPPSLHFFFLFTRKSSNNCAIFQFFSQKKIEPKPKEIRRCPRCERSFQVLDCLHFFVFVSTSSRVCFSLDRVCRNSRRGFRIRPRSEDNEDEKYCSGDSRG